MRRQRRREGGSRCASARACSTAPAGAASTLIDVARTKLLDRAPRWRRLCGRAATPAVPRRGSPRTGGSRRFDALGHANQVRAVGRGDRAAPRRRGAALSIHAAKSSPNVCATADLANSRKSAPAMNGLAGGRRVHGSAHSEPAAGRFSAIRIRSAACRRNKSGRRRSAARSGTIRDAPRRRPSVRRRSARRPPPCRRRTPSSAGCAAG